MNNKSIPFFISQLAEKAWSDKGVSEYLTLKCRQDVFDSLRNIESKSLISVEKKRTNYTVSTFFGTFNKVVIDDTLTDTMAIAYDPKSRTSVA